MHTTEGKLARSQALEVQEKKELVSKEEKTVPARYYVPTTDIFETEDALTVVMEIPGVEKEAVQVNIENDVLRVEARIDYSKYEGLEPLYTGCPVIPTSRFVLPASSTASDRRRPDVQTAMSHSREPRCALISASSRGLP